MRNKPNLAPVRIRAKYIAAKKLGAIRRNMDTGETKPILPLRIGGQTCRLRPAQANCAKQTQFPADKISHRSTIPSFRYSKREPIARNKANFSIVDCGLGTDPQRNTCPAACRLPPRTSPGADCAKQTQLAGCGNGC